MGEPRLFPASAAEIEEYALRTLEDPSFAHPSAARQALQNAFLSIILEAKAALSGASGIAGWDEKSLTQATVAMGAIHNFCSDYPLDPGSSHGNDVVQWTLLSADALAVANRADRFLKESPTKEQISEARSKLSGTNAESAVAKDSVVAKLTKRSVTLTTLDVFWDPSEMGQDASHINYARQFMKSYLKELNGLHYGECGATFMNMFASDASGISMEDPVGGQIMTTFEQISQHIRNKPTQHSALKSVKIGVDATYIAAVIELQEEGGLHNTVIQMFNLTQDRKIKSLRIHSHSSVSLATTAMKNVDTFVQSYCDALNAQDKGQKVAAMFGDVDIRMSDPAGSAPFTTKAEITEYANGLPAFQVFPQNVSIDDDDKGVALELLINIPGMRKDMTVIYAMKLDTSAATSSKGSSTAEARSASKESGAGLASKENVLSQADADAQVAVIVASTSAAEKKAQAAEDELKANLFNGVQDPKQAMVEMEAKRIRLAEFATQLEQRMRVVPAETEALPPDASDDIKTKLLQVAGDRTRMEAYVDQLVQRLACLEKLQSKKVMDLLNQAADERASVEVHAAELDAKVASLPSAVLKVKLAEAGGERARLEELASSLQNRLDSMQERHEQALQSENLKDKLVQVADAQARLQEYAGRLEQRFSPGSQSKDKTFEAYQDNVGTSSVPQPEQAASQPEQVPTAEQRVQIDAFIGDAGQRLAQLEQAVSADQHSAQTDEKVDAYVKELLERMGVLERLCESSQMAPAHGPAPASATDAAEVKIMADCVAGLEGRLSMVEKRSLAPAPASAPAPAPAPASAPAPAPAPAPDAAEVKRMADCVTSLEGRISTVEKRSLEPRSDAAAPTLNNDTGKEAAAALSQMAQLEKRLDALPAIGASVGSLEKRLTAAEDDYLDSLEKRLDAVEVASRPTAARGTSDALDVDVSAKTLDARAELDDIAQRLSTRLDGIAAARGTSDAVGVGVSAMTPDGRAELDAIVERLLARVDGIAAARGTSDAVGVGVSAMTSDGRAELDAIVERLLARVDGIASARGISGVGVSAMTSDASAELDACVQQLAARLNSLEKARREGALKEQPQLTGKLQLSYGAAGKLNLAYSKSSAVLPATAARATSDAVDVGLSRMTLDAKAELEAYVQKLAARLEGIAAARGPSDALDGGLSAMTSDARAELDAKVQKLADRLEGIEKGKQLIVARGTSDALDVGVSATTSDASDELDAYAQQLLIRLGGIEQSKRGPAVAPKDNQVEEKLASLAAENYQLHASLQQSNGGLARAEENFANIVAENKLLLIASQQSQAPASDNNVGEVASLRADGAQLMQMLEAERKNAGADRTEMMQKMEQMQAERKAAQDLQLNYEGQLREAMRCKVETEDLQLKETMRLKAESEDLRKTISGDRSVASKQFADLKQEFNALTSVCTELRTSSSSQGVPPAEHEALKGNLQRLEIELENQKNLRVPLGIPFEEHEALKQQLRMSVPIREFEALNRQLQSQVNPQEHADVKQKLQTAQSQLKETEQALLSVQQLSKAPSPEFMSVQSQLEEHQNYLRDMKVEHELQMQAQMQAQASVCDENEVLRQQLNAALVVDQTAVGKELEAIAAERKTFREMHERQQEQARNSVTLEEYEALAAKLADLQLSSVTLEKYDALATEMALRMETVAEARTDKPVSPPASAQVFAFQAQPNESNQGRASPWGVSTEPARVSPWGVATESARGQTVLVEPGAPLPPTFPEQQGSLFSAPTSKASFGSRHPLSAVAYGTASASRVRVESLATAANVAPAQRSAQLGPPRSRMAPNSGALMSPSSVRVGGSPAALATTFPPAAGMLNVPGQRFPPQASQQPRLVSAMPSSLSQQPVEGHPYYGAVRKQ